MPSKYLITKEDFSGNGLGVEIRDTPHICEKQCGDCNDCLYNESKELEEDVVAVVASYDTEDLANGQGLTLNWEDISEILVEYFEEDSKPGFTFTVHKVR